jgi:hypothetical protein
VFANTPSNAKSIVGMLDACFNATSFPHWTIRMLSAKAAKICAKRFIFFYCSSHLHAGQHVTDLLYKGLLQLPHIHRTDFTEPTTRNIKSKAPPYMAPLSPAKE